MATDDFTNTNGTALETHDSNWIYDSTRYEISSNNVVMDSSQSDRFAAYNDTFDGDHYSELVVAASGGDYIGVGTRIQDADSGYGFYGNTGATYLVELDNAAWNYLGGTTGAAAISVNDVMRLTSEGTTHTPTIDGSTTGTPGAGTDATFTGGLPGLFFSAAYNTNSRGNDWVGLDVGAGGGSTALPLINAYYG